MKGLKLETGRCLKVFMWILSSVLLSCGNVLSDTVYVRPPGNAPQDPYNAWTNAANDIQTAVNAAQANGWTNVVVSNAVYTLSSEITVDAGIYLRSWNHGHIDQTNTIVDGDGQYRGFVLNSADAVLDGFKVRNATNNYAVLVNGGTVRNCDISGNHTTGLWMNGGVLKNSTVSQNVAVGHGGGMYLSGGATVRNCIISDNTTLNYGGGAYCAAAATFIECDIINNNAVRGGGLKLPTANASLVTIENCLIADNTASHSGGALRQRGGKLVLLNTRIFRNSTQGINAYIEANRPGRSLTMRNCLMVGNSGGTTLAFNSLDPNSFMLIENCTIVSNRNIGTSIAAGTNTFINNIIQYNYNGANLANTANEQLAAWTNNCVFKDGVDFNDYGKGNIPDDPDFVDATTGDFRLNPKSPCVNAGSNQGWMFPRDTDLDGNPRIDNFSGIVDIGAYEVHSKGMIMRFF